MFGGLNRLLAATAVAGAALVVPSAALACNNGTSAEAVYHECLPSGSGGSHASTPSRGGTGNGSSGHPGLSGAAAKALKHAGKDRRALALVERTGPNSRLRSNPSSSVAEPSTVGSAFDLGSGPGAFLIALAGSALLLLGGSGLRIWHHRRR